MNKDRKNILSEALAAFLSALTLAAAIIYFQPGKNRGLANILIAAVWLYLPIIFIAARKSGFSGLALDKLSAGQSIKWFAIVSITIFPVFYLAAGLGATGILHWQFNLKIPDRFWSFVIGQLLLISLPEEFFFRGYLQGRLNQALGKKWKFLAAEIGPGLFIAAALFALAHFAFQPYPDRLLVFFPALVFGWLREKTDSLIAPVLFHFSSNLSFIIFQLSLIK